MTFEYDDRKLRELFGEMDEKHRLKALKSAFRAEGNKVRKIAAGNLRSKMRSNRKLETCIRVVVSKKKPQFTVTVSPKGRTTRSGKNGGGRQAKGYYTNRRGFSIPVLVWAEDGTKPRYTRRTAGNRGSRIPAEMAFCMISQATFLWVGAMVPMQPRSRPSLWRDTKAPAA